MRKVASTITTRRAREGSVRVLNRSDLPAAIRLLSANPIENVFVASRVRAAGLEQASLGCPVWGYERGGLLRALCHAGSNLVPVNADEQALNAWTEFAGPDLCIDHWSGGCGAGAVEQTLRAVGRRLERGPRRATAPACHGHQFTASNCR